MCRIEKKIEIWWELWEIWDYGRYIWTKTIYKPRIAEKQLGYDFWSYRSCAVQKWATKLAWIFSFEGCEFASVSRPCWPSDDCRLPEVDGLANSNKHFERGSIKLTYFVKHKRTLFLKHLAANYWCKLICCSLIPLRLFPDLPLYYSFTWSVPFSFRSSIILSAETKTRYGTKAQAFPHIFCLPAMLICSFNHDDVNSEWI